MSKTNGFRKYNYLSKNGARHARNVSIDVELYDAIVKMAKRQKMTVAWFIEEVLEVTIGVNVPIVKNVNTKKAYASNRD